MVVCTHGPSYLVGRGWGGGTADGFTASWVTLQNSLTETGWGLYGKAPPVLWKGSRHSTRCRGNSISVWLHNGNRRAQEAVSGLASASPEQIQDIKMRGAGFVPGEA